MNFENIKDEKVRKVVVRIIKTNRLSLEQKRDICSILMTYLLFFEMSNELKAFNYDDYDSVGGVE